MQRDGQGSERARFPRVAANDNPGSKAGTGGGPDARIEDAVMRFARLLGRQIARETFEATRPANHNAPEKEALDRVSRDQADVATLCKHLHFAGVMIVTLAEGEINELHVECACGI